ncbi:hypothetical protein HMPREF9103_01605 [Lentilactobacillus parafarraginis F0439]|uniref:2'-5' RNA ligase n=1 Tax=Lentilactobacillus parafarraginis F0439 TaxID=797515 RepID=G9ZPF1_9LACO|nr:2'-5' RNA ligase family protein [Lentilactobacillus parafarraginis]EHL98365.1 hypothetical protein HMPREF9103_01605 [Lentilactobacillus parafarraginis F0439]
MMRSILIFPKLKNIELIQDVRKEIDPLYPHIRPHISLVFPFDSAAPDHDLIDQLSTTLASFPSFDATFSRVTGDPRSGYIWLAANKGRAEIQSIHDQLYSNPLLAPFKRNDLPYIPHITIGQVQSRKQAQIEISKLQLKGFHCSTRINTVSIERILESDDSDEFYQQKLI